MPALTRRFLVFAVAAATAAAQPQSWVPMHAPEGAGIGVLQSPLPPRLLQVSQPLLQPPSVQVVDFVGNAFHRRGERLPAELAFAQAAVYDAANARIVVWCSTFVGVGSGGSAAVCTFDGARWSVATTNLPPARTQPALAYDPARAVVVLFGGLVNGFPIGTPRNDVWELRGSSWTQPPNPNPPPPRFAAALAFDPPTQRLVLFGGASTQSLLGDTWSYHGAWSQLSSSGPSPRRSAALAFDPLRQRLLLCGGVGQVLGGNALGDAFEWGSSSWMPTTAPPVALEAGALLHDGGTLLLIGRDAVAQQSGAWQRLGSSWAPRRQHAEVAARYNPAFAFDPLRNELVRFGGRDLATATWFDGTWTFAGSWQRRNPALAPSPRSHATMAFDALRGECVLFGGFDGSMLGDTWVWNGSSWAQRQPAQSPPARHQHAMEFDPSRGTVLLYGGGSTGVAFQDTWEWNGSGWSQLATPMPSPLQYQSLAYDHGNQLMMLYLDGGNLRPSELWQLFGGSWMHVSSAAPASARMVYDPARSALALFANGQRFDWVNGVFAPDPVPAVVGYYLVDRVLGQLLSYSPATDHPVFRSVPVAASVEAQGQGCGPLGKTTLAFDRAPQLGVAARWQVRTLSPSAPVLLLLALQPANVPLGNGCTGLVGGPLATVFTLGSADGWAEVAAAVPAAPALLGLPVHGQAAVLLPPATLAFSNGVRLLLGQ